MKLRTYLYDNEYVAEVVNLKFMYITGVDSTKVSAIYELLIALIGAFIAVNEFKVRPIEVEFENIYEFKEFEFWFVDNKFEEFNNYIKEESFVKNILFDDNLNKIIISFNKDE